MNILCDVDGCICSYPFPKIIKKYFGVSIPTKAIFAYSLEDCLGVSSAVVGVMFKVEAMQAPVFIKGALDALKQLRAEGHLIFIYTNRVRFMTDGELVDWLQLYGIPFDCLYKGQERVFDFHVDDSPAKLMGTNGLVKRKLLFDQPWNKGCLNITGKLERVKSWKAVLRKIHDDESRRCRDSRGEVGLILGEAHG